jgi:hypothetical protein
MSTPREELHAMIDALPEDAAADLVPDMRAILKHRMKAASRAAERRPWPPSWFGAITEGEPDTSERIDEILEEEFGRRLG